MTSLVSKLFGSSSTAKRDEEISKIVPISECSHDCDSCTTKYPSSVKIDNGDIYNSAKPTDLHFIVPTGVSDWAHDATSTPNTIQNELVRWKDKYGDKVIPKGNIKVSTSNLPIDRLNQRVVKGEVNDVLILPYFVWLKKIDIENLSTVLNELIPILVNSKIQSSEFQLPKVIQHYEIVPSNAHSYIFLCSHKTRDKRCAVTAPLMKKEMDQRLRDTGHYRDFGDDRPNGVFVTFINHVGGHKFAANVIIYNKTGEIIWLAKCTPQNAEPIIDETVLGGGKVWGDLVRVVQKGKAIDW